jgi:CheY-like chemotaxis protein
MSSPRTGNSEGDEMNQILVVEDDQDMQIIYRFMFKDEAHRFAIQIVADAGEALRIINQKPFDLVISDIIMRTQGECFIERLRTEEKNHMPVLVVSVLNPDMLARLKKMHGVYFLQKPITKEKLLKKINSILRKKGDAS